MVPVVPVVPTPVVAHVPVKPTQWVALVPVALIHVVAPVPVALTLVVAPVPALLTLVAELVLVALTHADLAAPVVSGRKMPTPMVMASSLLQSARQPRQSSRNDARVGSKSGMLMATAKFPKRNAKPHAKIV